MAHCSVSSSVSVRLVLCGQLLCAADLCVYYYNAKNIDFITAVLPLPLPAALPQPQC
jgi:hypothetical protein